MSTRCQVFVTQTGLYWTQTVALYHHWDGYPTNMLPLLRKGRNIGIDDRATYEMGRAGKAASMICASDPKGFEVEASIAIHPDIEWLYLVEVRNTPKTEIASWLVTVMRPNDGFYSLKREPTLSDFHQVGENWTVDKAAEEAEKIEAME